LSVKISVSSSKFSVKIRTGFTFPGAPGSFKFKGSLREKVDEQKKGSNLFEAI
jgi:hypothetical protein